MAAAVGKGSSVSRFTFSMGPNSTPEIQVKVEKLAVRALEHLGATHNEHKLLMLQKNLASSQNDAVYGMINKLLVPITDAIKFRIKPLPAVKLWSREELMVYSRIFLYAVDCVNSEQSKKDSLIRAVLTKARGSIESQKKISNEAGQKAEIEFQNLLPSFILPAAHELIKDLKDNDMAFALKDVEMWKSPEAEFEGLMKASSAYAPPDLLKAMHELQTSKT